MKNIKNYWNKSIENRTKSDEIRCFDIDTEYDIALISEIKNIIKNHCPNYVDERIIAGKDYRESLRIEKYKYK